MSTAAEAPVGSFETLRFARLLAQFWERGFTGSLRARAAVRPGVTVTKEILFERGRVAWAASDDPEESIRVHLFNRGMLRPDEWRLAEEKSTGSAQVRQTLVDLGFLTARELQEADRERVAGIVLSLFSWREGRYEAAASPLPLGTPNLKVDPRDLILEGLMASGDRGRVLDEIGSLDAVLVVRPDDLVRASLSLPVELVALMGKADGTRTIADICAVSPLPDFLISAAFAGLKVLGLARPLDAPAAAAPPAAPAPPSERPPVRRRSGRTASEAAAATPRLPLEEVPEADTVPMATPPGGVRAQAADAPPAREESVEESGTRPLRSVPSRVLVPEAAASSADHEAVIVRESAGIPAAAAAAAGAPQPIAEAASPPPFDALLDEEEEVDREVELVLKPGIPVAAASAGASMAGPMEGASDQELEGAVETLGATFEESDDASGPEIERAGAFEEADASGAEEPLDAAAEDQSAGSGEPEDQEEPADGEEASGEPPPWIYEPASETRPPGSSRRWAAWGGIAAAFLGLAAGLILIFGTGGEAESRHAEGGFEAGGPGPADVEPPPAFASDDAPSTAAAAPESGAASAPAPAPAPAPTSAPAPAGVAAASVGEPAPAPGPASRAGTGAAGPAGATGGVARARAPAPARAPSESGRPRPTRAVASGAAGPILTTAGFREGRRLLAGGDLAGAARRFSAAVADRKGLYTVQLAIACEPPTVAQAVQTARDSSQLFILPAQIGGRSCYRMLWGAYASRPEADRARRSIPARFLKDPNPPFVRPL